MPFEAWALPGGAAPYHDTPRRDVGADPAHFSYLDLSPRTVGGLARELARSRAAGLARVPLERILEAVDGVARRFLNPRDPLREEAVGLTGGFSGYSRAMAERVVERMARDWTRPRLEALLRSEFPDPLVLDGFRPGPQNGRVRAQGYPLTFHLGAGTVPGVTTTSMIRALLVKSAVLAKPGRGDTALPVLFARALADLAPELGGAVAVLYWPGSETERTEAALDASDMVVVYGGNSTVEWVRRRAPVRTGVLGYRHRLGVGLVGRGALREGGDTAREAAEAVALFDQRGCVSPHLFLVEEGGEMSPEGWAQALAQALEELEHDLPSGVLSSEEAANLHQLRGKAEVEEGGGKGFVRHGGTEAPWTVLYSPEPRLLPSCLGRTVRVLPLASMRKAPVLLEEWAPHLQTVGVAGQGEGWDETLEGLAALGVSRVVPLKDVAWPPPWWHHDGTGPLVGLVRWTDVEGSE